MAADDIVTDPLTWLLPNGLLFMQADWQTTLLNYTSRVETPLPNITIAQKTYPASYVLPPRLARTPADRAMAVVERLLCFR